MRKLAVLMILTVLLAACGPTTAPTAIPATNTPVPVGSPTITSTPTKTPQDGKLAIAYSRSGGIAGVMEEWWIFTNGGIVSNKGQEATLPPERVAGLLSEIESLGFFGMQDSYGGGVLSPCRDCFTYRLSVSRGEKAKTITTQDGATGTPAELGQILGKVQELVESIPKS